MEIRMPPLSQAKLPQEKEVLFGEQMRDSAPDAAQYQISSSSAPVQVKSKNKYDDEQAILNIINKQPITTNLDKAYIKTMHQQLQSETFKDWSVQNVNLTNRSNQQRLSLYQPAMKELAYRNHADQKFYNNV